LKILIAFIFILVSFSFCLANCGLAEGSIKARDISNLNHDTTGLKMKITIGTAVFTAILQDHASANAFKALLPMTLQMSDLNNNEKFFYFTGKLPVNPSRGGNIQTGDLMLYGNNCLVLFYESFNTSYSYTRLGRIENILGLAAALGTGNVVIKFE